MSKTESGVGRQGAGGWTDWWVHAALPLAIADLVLYVALHSRPGPVALVLWRWGPPLLLVAIMTVLVLALVSSLRGRLTWNWRRGAALATVCALILTMGAYGTFPSAYDFTPSQVVLDLPLDGPVTVAWGGPSASTNYHVASPAERWGYDLLIANDGISHQGEGQAVTDFFAYDRPVRAPASGLVIDMRDGVPDARPGRAQAWRGGGNSIVLEIAPREYLFMVHLRSGTIRVRKGDHVERGDVVARVGNSGNTSEPHLHVHVQDSPTAGDGQGVPFHFGNYVLDGTGETVSRGMPEGGVRRGRYIGDVVTAVPRH
jgi:murein DD-endopeptidase MepM/ murein hydrolase activator NlpD